MPLNAAGKSLDLEHYVRLLSRQKWFLLTPALIGLLVMSVYSYSLPDLYSAKATILVEPASLPKEFMKSTLPYGPEAYLRTLVEQIKSRSRLEQVIEQYNLYPDQRREKSGEEVVQFMRGRITIEQRANDTFSVAFSDEDPETVMNVTNTLTRMFVDENLKYRIERSENNVAFLENQARELRQLMLQNERRVQEYKSRHVESLPENRSSNEVQLTSAQQRLQVTSASLAGSTARLGAVRDRIVMLGEAQNAAATVVPGGERRELTLEQKHQAAKQALASLELQLSEKHPDVKAARKEVAALEQDIARQPRSNGSPARQPRSLEFMRALEEERLLQAEITQLQSDQVALNAQIVELTRRIELTPHIELELKELSRDLDVLKDKAEDFAKKATDATASLALEKQNQGSQFRTLDAARKPGKPDWPNRPMLILIGLAVGLVLGLGLVIGLDLLFRPFLDEEDLARFSGVPVLESVPHLGPFPSEWQRFKRQLSHLLNYLLGSTLLGGARYAPSTLKVPVSASPEPVEPSELQDLRAVVRASSGATKFSYLTGEPLDVDPRPEQRLLVQTPGTRGDAVSEFDARKPVYFGETFERHGETPPGEGMAGSTLWGEGTGRHPSDPARPAETRSAEPAALDLEPPEPTLLKLSAVHAPLGLEHSQTQGQGEQRLATARAQGRVAPPEPVPRVQLRRTSLWAEPGRIQVRPRWFLDERPSYQELTRELTAEAPWERPSEESSS